MSPGQENVHSRVAWSQGTEIPTQLEFEAQSPEQRPRTKLKDSSDWRKNLEILKSNQMSLLKA